MSTAPWLFLAVVLTHPAPACTARIGIVTMHSPEIMSYANSTGLINQMYADRHSYGFHILNHTIDTLRVPHWSKILAILMHLPDYDFVFWIDADAIFYDQSLRIEEALKVEENWRQSDTEIWGQDMWPDYPSLHRKEIMDGGTFMVRNSLWTRRFLIELYHYPSCLDFLNFTEQFCFSVAYEANLLDVKQKTKILPTPTINHHILPPPRKLGSLRDSLFIWHLSGRSDEMRVRTFRLVYDNFAAKFVEVQYQSFWLFYQLFARQNFGDMASLQLCMFGIGHRQQAMLEAVMYHFPYITGFVLTHLGTPGLFTQMKQSEVIGEKFGSRMAAMDLYEYRRGVTATGEKFVKGFFCDILMLSVESWRHLKQGTATLLPLIKAGMEHYDGPRGKGFGYSGIQDVFMALIDESCKVADPETFRETGHLLMAREGEVLDADDHDGSALQAACELMSDLQVMMGEIYQGAQADDQRQVQMVLRRTPEAGPVVQSVLGEESPSEVTAIPWDRLDPARWSIESLESVTLARLPRFAFPSIPNT